MSLAESEARRLTLVLHELQRKIDYRLRGPIADEVAQVTRTMMPAEGSLSSESVARAERLKRDGLIRLGRLLTETQVRDIHAYLKDKPCFTGHVPPAGDKVPRTIEECARLANCGSYSRIDVLRAPHLLELANRRELIELAEAYLGCPPTIYSINLFWSFPNRDEKNPPTQLYHRDFDDFRFCTLFIFLTDIRTEDGAHFYMRGTHQPEFVQQAYEERVREPRPFPLERLFLVAAYDDRDCQNIFQNEIEFVVGKAGHGVLEDTYGLHKGDVPKTPRLLGWVRYGLYHNTTAFGDNPDGPLPASIVAGRIPDSPRHRFMNRVLVRPEAPLTGT